MSYAEAAASGPPQSAEEAYVIRDSSNGQTDISSLVNNLLQNRRAPPPPSVESTTSTNGSSLVDVDSPHVASVSSDFPSQSVKTDTQATRIDHEEQDRERADAHIEQQRRKQEGLLGLLKRNRDNPVVLGNAVVVGAVAGVLGWSGWRWLGGGGRARQSSAGTSLGLVAGAVGVVGLFGLADYFVSKWALGKYPVRK